MIKLRVLPPNPNNASDEAGMDEFLSAFGVTPPASGEQTDPPSSDPADPPADPPQDPPAGDPPTDPPSDPDPPKQTDPAGQSTQAAQAFAQMRVQNKKYEGMLKGIADVLGIKDVSDTESITQALQQKITTAQAQKQGIPPEILEKLNRLEESDRLTKQDQIRQTAFLGFQKVKDAYGLDDKGLQAFADVLQADGINPFEQPVDVFSEYRIRNFEKLLSEAEARGAQKEAERAANANKSGSTPNKNQGQSSADAEKINTISGLTKWFDENAK